MLVGESSKRKVALSDPRISSQTSYALSGAESITTTLPAAAPAAPQSIRRAATNLQHLHWLRMHGLIHYSMRVS